MSTMKTKKFRIEAAVLTAVGLLLSVLIGRDRLSMPMLWLADMLFVEATVFLTWGLVHQLGNMHAFTSLTWGFRQFHRIFRKEKMSAAQEKEDYVKYRSTRAHHSDAIPLLVMGGIWLLLSLVVSLTLV